MQSELFTSPADSVSSNRIIYTPSTFARSSLIHLQETGTLQARRPHKNERSGLNSYLFFTVLSGAGRLVCGKQTYELAAGDSVFIDCRRPYSHETGAVEGEELWSLQWCHFYGPNMNAVYRKYQERGGRPVFKTKQLSSYISVMDELYTIAESADYVRDMRLHEKLSSLLVLLMEDAWDEERNSPKEADRTVDIQQVKEYIDANFTDKITLDSLAARFYINKYYLQTLFKDRYGSTVNTYLNRVRITYVKQQLRFGDKTIETLAEELNIEPPYLSRLFKKVEGVSPSQFRRSWRGKI